MTISVLLSSASWPLGILLCPLLYPMMLLLLLLISQATLRQQKAALEVQTQMNRELMSRKQEVEWQLMTAMARVPPPPPPLLPILLASTPLGGGHRLCGFP